MMQTWDNGCVGGGAGLYLPARPRGDDDWQVKTGYKPVPRVRLPPELGADEAQQPVKGDSTHRMAPCGDACVAAHARTQFGAWRVKPGADDDRTRDRAGAGVAGGCDGSDGRPA